ncbi:MAG: alpha/beta hydrolase [Candidatus Hydrogenedentes bacterium]|nr:alpha/beta hydrolase [Candidatus Hydrogenedentota bacterium]
MFKQSILLALVLLAALAAGVVQAVEEVEKDSLRITRDIPYSSAPLEKPRLNQLDIYRPLNGSNLPVLVFIHGGSWRYGDKRFVSEKPAYFTAQGFVFVSVNYQLAPEVSHPVYVQDVAKAIAWLQGHVAEYGGDPKRMVVMGHSSGAHLSALVATDDRYLKEAGSGLDALRGVIVLDGGGYDIPRMANSGEPFAKSRYDKAFTEDTAVWKDASPITYVAPDKGIPPFLLVHAGKRQASADQAKEFAAALQGAGVRAEIFHEPGKNHLTINSSIGKNGDATTEAILSFIKSVASPSQ